MNNLNERTMQPSDLVVISTETLKDRKIEVFPDFFVYESRTKVELTNAGRIYLSALCQDYFSDLVSVEELLANVQTIANEFSGWVGEVEDKLWSEFYKIAEQCN